MKSTLTISILISLLADSQSRIYERCPLARELYYVHGISVSEIPNMLCFIDKSAAYDTSLVLRAIDGSSNHGLFQFNDQWWCTNPSSDKGPGANICQTLCSAMTDDNISDDMKCATRYFADHHIETIDVWINHCKKDLSMYLDGCHI